MTFATIQSQISPHGIATVTLDRPERSNAFNQLMMDELDSHIRKLGADDTVRVVVVRGAGRHFCAGADVGQAKDAQQGAVKHTGFVDLFLTLDACLKPTIAVVHGACIGGAVALVACCDVVIATDAAVFSIPEVRIGVSPVGVTPPLVRAMGVANYRRYALSGERFGAAEAQRIGLVGALCTPADLEAKVAETTEAFLLGAPGAMRELKAHLARLYPDTTTDLVAAGAHHAGIDTFGTPEALEGVAAFKQKRKPKWYPG